MKLKDFLRVFDADSEPATAFEAAATEATAAAKAAAAEAATLPTAKTAATKTTSMAVVMMTVAATQYDRGRKQGSIFLALRALVGIFEFVDFALLHLQRGIVRGDLRL
jgi:hypothetical protein